MLKTYWDLEEKERAALIREEVERFLDAELMTKGVLKVAPLVLDQEPNISEPATSTYYWLSGVSEVVFSTARDAELFADLGPLRLGSEYLNSDYRQAVKYASPVEGTDINEIRLASRDEIALRRSDLEKRSAIRSSNEKRREQYDKDTRAQSKVLDGLWEDWARCRNVDQTHRRVVSTFNDYVKTAGDADTAARFLAKAFSVSAIKEASEWCGVEIPEPVEYNISDFDAGPEPSLKAQHAENALDF